MKHTFLFLLALITFLSFNMAGPLSTVQASIIVDQNVNPDDPATWDTLTQLLVGDTSNGSLTINEGSSVSTYIGLLGGQAGVQGVATITGAGSTWTNSNDFGVGIRGTGTLYVTDGGVLNNASGYMGFFSSSVAIATIAGPNSTWNNSNKLYVGGLGNAILNINDGGRVNSVDASVASGDNKQGTVNISGTDALWENSKSLTVGVNGKGTINVRNAGTLNTGDNVCLGDNTGSLGTVNVSGTGSTWTNNGWTNLGNRSNGKLSITYGAVVNSNATCTMGVTKKATGIAIISGAGSTWNTRHLSVSIIGNSQVNINNSGTVNSTWGTIGSQANSHGTVTVTGTNSTWTCSGGLTIGSHGTGTLNIDNGGMVTVLGQTWVASQTGSSGVIHLGNGTLNTDWLNAGSTQLVGTGTINTKGMIADGMDIIFDNTHGLQQQFLINDHGQNVTVNLDYTSAEPGDFGAGYSSNGSVTIRDGISIGSFEGHIGRDAGSNGAVTVSGTDSTWAINYTFNIGNKGSGTLNILDGGTVSNQLAYIGKESGSVGTVTVAGVNSQWISDSCVYVGAAGSGTLHVTSGASVISPNGVIGNAAGLTNTATVSGVGSTWKVTSQLRVGHHGPGELNISDGGLVSLGRSLEVDHEATGESFVNMSTGGMLAIIGQADGSLNDFLELVSGTDAIRWWDGDLDDWALLTSATEGMNYSLEYFSDGDLAGHTILTVQNVPEPTTISLLLLGGLTILFARKFSVINNKRRRPFFMDARNI